MLFCIILICVIQNIKNMADNGGIKMNIKTLLLCSSLAFIASPVFAADSLFFEDEMIQDGINVVQTSNTFAEIYEKLDGIKWAGKDINVAIESLEGLHTDAHIAATDERVVLVWRDSIIANYPRPKPRDWHGFGEITTALVLKMRAQDATLHAANANQIYQMVVDTLTRGIDENGRYIYSREAEITEDGRILTSVGLEGIRDARGNYRVDGVYKGSPADTAGINMGDLIVQINGVPTSKMSDAELHAAISGFNSGTSKIKLLTPAGQKDVVLRRATIVIADADVVHRSDPDTGDILEIVIHKVSDDAVAIVNEALNKYVDLSGIILDLRAASGDNERSAAKLAGLFVGQTPVMRVVQTALDEIEVIPGANAITNVPVVVLVSNMTRGTAEAVAAAFYENARGVLVGTPTAGAARIATRLNLNNGGALELLNKVIKTGTGRTIDGRGIYPIVCLSNIRSSSQQNAFFLNVINNDFRAHDYNKDENVKPSDIRRGCPTITSGADEDALSAAVSVKILTDKKVYKKLIAE